VAIDIERFCRDGFTSLVGAVADDVVEEARRAVWRVLGDQGITADDRSTWAQPVIRVRCLDEALIEAQRAPALRTGYDALVGAGRWLPPGGAGDVIPVRFPSEAEPADAAWHVEGNWKGPEEFHTDVWSSGRGLFVLILLTNVGLDDAPMGMIPGSHLYVPSVLEPHGSNGLGGRAIVEAVNPTVMCRRAAFATGMAGDAYLCHPFLIHTATWPHRGRQPRFAVVVKLEIDGGFAVDGTDTSPVGRTITSGLGMR
jgi:hypothetical protein